MDEYQIVSIKKVDYTFAPGEVEILEFLNEVGEANVDTLDSIVKGVDTFGPIDIPFVFGFAESYLKKTMMRTLLDVMRKKGFITILDDKVRITETGKLTLHGINRVEDLENLPLTSFNVSNDGSIILETGYYLATVDRPFESDGIVIPACYLGIHTQYVLKDSKYIEFLIPIRTRMRMPCKLLLRKL